MEGLVDACPNERYLVHSDLLYYNLLVDQDRVTAVLDWGSSLYGDFLWDLAWFTFWQPWYTAWSAVDLRAAALSHYAEIGQETPNFEERLRCYELAIGLDGLAFARRGEDQHRGARAGSVPNPYGRGRCLSVSRVSCLSRPLRGGS